MATLVPKTPVQQSKPEVIFVANQGSSMQGARTKTWSLRFESTSIFASWTDLQYLLLWNSSFLSFLFEGSQMCDQSSLEKALKSLDGLDGRYGGTETLAAVRASNTFRDNTQLLSIILATDGDIWQQQELFDYINDSVATSKNTFRVFALGIGNLVSSALIGGVALAGDRVAQFVGEGEKFYGKVIRTLRGALTPDHVAYTTVIQYRKHDDEDEFVMVERVSGGLRVLKFADDDWPVAQFGKEHATSAETTAGGEKDVEMPVLDNQARFKHVPAVPATKVIQTPQKYPASIQPFQRLRPNLPRYCAGYYHYSYSEGQLSRIPLRN